MSEIQETTPLLPPPLSELQPRQLSSRTIITLITTTILLLVPLIITITSLPSLNISQLTLIDEDHATIDVLLKLPIPFTSIQDTKIEIHSENGNTSWMSLSLSNWKNRLARHVNLSSIIDITPNIELITSWFDSILKLQKTTPSKRFLTTLHSKICLSKLCIPISHKNKMEINPSKWFDEPILEFTSFEQNGTKPYPFPSTIPIGFNVTFTYPISYPIHLDSSNLTLSFTMSTIDGDILLSLYSSNHGIKQGINKLIIQGYTNPKTHSILLDLISMYSEGSEVIVRLKDFELSKDTIWNSWLQTVDFLYKPFIL